MVKYIKTIQFFAVLTWLFACDERIEQIVVEDQRTLIEKRLMGNWQYLSLSANGFSTPIATEFMEPLAIQRNSRDTIFRRHLRLLDSYTYRLEWVDRGAYELGTEGDPNWQPSQGFWSLNEDQTEMIHNKGTDYEVTYRIIQVTDNVMIRETDRYMSQDGQVWMRGDTVRYQETFIRLVEE